MEKLVLKGKKEVKTLLIDSLHQTIQALGVSKTNKKTEKLIKKYSKNLAIVVDKQRKKELKKLGKLKKKTEHKKVVAPLEPA